MSNVMKKTSTNPVLAGLQSVTSPFVRWVKRGQLRLRLEQLDNRLLEDIGITYDEIPAFVKQVYPTFNWTNILKAVVKSITKWQERTRLLAELQSMSDDMLQDIGITRGDIHNVVYNGMERPKTSPVAENVHFLNINTSNSDKASSDKSDAVKRKAA